MQNSGYVNLTCVFYTSVDDNFFCGHGETHFQHKIGPIETDIPLPKAANAIFSESCPKYSTLFMKYTCLLTAVF